MRIILKQNGGKESRRHYSVDEKIVQERISRGHGLRRPLNKKLTIGIVFLFETTLSQELLEEFTYYFGIVPVEYTKHHRHGLPLIDYLSFLTSIFLHGGWLQKSVEANKETPSQEGII